jgi:acyl-CoA synthetase (AMP-forming)/AMP-acid ligase II
MINAGGYKIFPRDVEDVLYQHPAAREACVVGVPDEYRGEAVKAFVSLVPDISATPEELIDFCRVRMAVHEYPQGGDPGRAAPEHERQAAPARAARPGSTVMRAHPRRALVRTGGVR